MKNDCLGFPEVKWLDLTGEVDKSVSSSMSNFLRISHTRNYLNRLIFDRVIQKN